MKGLLADADIAGQVRALVEQFFESPEWLDVWKSMGIRLEIFADFGLVPRSPDDVVWQTCQDNGLVLITGNRNEDGPTSLQATIRERLGPDSLPVITVAKPKSLGKNAAYTARIGIRVLDYLLNIEGLRGTGRLYVP